MMSDCSEKKIFKYQNEIHQVCTVLLFKCVKPSGRGGGLMVTEWTGEQEAYSCFDPT